MKSGDQLYEKTTRLVEENVTGYRSTAIDGIHFDYFIYRDFDGYEHGNAKWCWVDSDGTIYVSELLDIHKEHRDGFHDLIAYHERLEYDWLREMGLPAPRFNIKENTRESEIAAEIHMQVHFLELVAAKDMGILDEYVGWRPHEAEVTDKFTDLTDRFYHKLKS